MFLGTHRHEEFRSNLESNETLICESDICMIEPVTWSEIPSLVIRTWFPLLQL